jgi:hypothetical protein
MQSQNNPVFQVLVPKGNQALLAAGNPASALLPGQIGFFSAVDGLSFVAAGAGAIQNGFRIGVGLDLDGDGVTDDIIFSAGQYIQNKGVEHMTLRCFTPARQQVTEFTGYKVSCESSNTLKFALDNQEAALNFGFNKPFKTFDGWTSDCNPAASCPTCGDTDAWTRDMVKQINADDDKMLVADMIDYTTTPGTSIIVADSGYAAWVAANPTVDLGIQVRSNPLALVQSGNINVNYTPNRMTSFQMFAIDGWGGGNAGTITNKQLIIQAEGIGYDIKQLEYEAGGWNGKPGINRQNGISGLPVQGFFYQVTDVAAKYTVFTITNNFKSVAGAYAPANASLSTIVAIPCGETTTGTPFFATIDAIPLGREPLSNDYSACPSCTTANVVETLTAATDGDAS